MGQAKGTTAYPSARALLERAIESEKGIKINLGSWKKAFRMRMNCYTVRKRARDLSIKTYPIDHPLHNTSPWDDIEMTLTESGDLILTRGLPLEVEEL